VKVKVNTLMGGQWPLIATDLSNLLYIAYCKKRPRVILIYRVVQKTDTLCFVRLFVGDALISSNIDRISNLFHCLNQKNIRNNTVDKYPTTPQVCRYTTL